MLEDVSLDCLLNSYATTRAQRLAQAPGHIREVIESITDPDGKEAILSAVSSLIQKPDKGGKMCLIGASTYAYQVGHLTPLGRDTLNSFASDLNVRYYW